MSFRRGIATVLVAAAGIAGTVQPAAAGESGTFTNTQNVGNSALHAMPCRSLHSTDSQIITL